MRSLLVSCTVFWSAVAVSAADDAADLIFPTGAQNLDSDFLWNDPDVDLGFATGDLEAEASGNHNPELFDDGSNGEYLSYDGDFIMSAMDDNEQPRFGFESICATNEGLVTDKARRGNQCSGKENSLEPKRFFGELSLNLMSVPIAPSPGTENDPGSTDKSDSPQPEPQPLSSSLLGVPFGDLCPPDKVPGKVPLCCEGRPYRYFVSNCINCEFTLAGSLHFR